MYRFFRLMFSVFISAYHAFSALICPDTLKALFKSHAFHDFPGGEVFGKTYTDDEINIELAHDLRKKCPDSFCGIASVRMCLCDVIADLP